MDEDEGNIQIELKHPFYLIDYDKIKAIVHEIRLSLKIDQYGVFLKFTDAQYIRSLNYQFRTKDQSTDVLSFPMLEWPKPKTLEDPQVQPTEDLPCLTLGDLVISLDDAQKNASAIGQGIDREVCFLLLHGILHLCGHDHRNPQDEGLMMSEQKKFMKQYDQKDLWKDCVQRREV